MADRPAAGAPTTEPTSERRCAHIALGDIESRCEREHGHGGAHTCAVSTDPHWEYVISWWPKALAAAGVST